MIKNRSLKNWKIVELGCGSGLLAEQVIKYVDEYIGVDIAASAIEFAQKKNKNPKIKFMAKDVLNISLKKNELMIFLGLTDWFEIDQLFILFSKITSDNILFSFTESRSVTFLSPYRYYRNLIDRKSSKFHYKARSYSEVEIEKILKHFGYSFEVVKPATLINPGVLVWAKK
jgi:SAM-dependent methyltransferase